MLTRLPFNKGGNKAPETRKMRPCYPQFRQVSPAALGFVALNHLSLVLQPLARPRLRFRTAAPWLRLARLGAALLRAGRAARTSTSASHCTHRATTSCQNHVILADASKG